VDRPKIRAVEAFPIDDVASKTRLVCLRDPLGYASQPIGLGIDAYYLVTLFDGNHSLEEIARSFARRFGEQIELGRLRELVNALDSAYYLDSPRLAARIEELRAEFQRGPTRAAVHAGLCYESEPTRLRAELAAWFDPPEGPGRSSARKPGVTPAGIIAPHIDPRRGGAAYAHAYAELMGRNPPELFIILGTSHYGVGPELFSATLKDYATPFGSVETDRDFINRLKARYNGDLLAEELLHRNEHSIEFQALFLAWVLGTRGYKVVPILVSSFHQMVIGGELPARHPRVASFLDSIRTELARDGRKVCIIAGVDFAHVGKKFGDPFAADENVTGELRGEDEALIEIISRGDPDGFFGAIERVKDRRRICGLAPMYTQLELLRGRTGRLLRYGLAPEPQTESAVSFASLAID
jgi:AmmeMemoRadiSam system protein B